MTTRKIQVRRGTSAQWATANTVLAAGEWGYDTTAKISKIGDGSTAWDDLPALRGSLPYSAYLTGGTESNMAGWLAARDSGVGNVLVLGTSHPYGWGTTDPSNDAWPFRLAAKIGATRGMEPHRGFPQFMAALSAAWAGKVIPAAGGVLIHDGEGRLLAGGSVPDDLPEDLAGGNYISPTEFADVAPDARIESEVASVRKAGARSTEEGSA